MPTERVLIELVTAANMSGLKEAQAGFLGLTPQIALAGAALAGLVFVGKSAIQNYEAQQKATLELTQAYATQKDTLTAHQKQIDAFLETNKNFISDTYDTQLALANLVRSGLNPGNEAFRVLNDALDLSVIKHESVSEAAKTITLAEAGTSKGLRDLGITTADYNKIMNDKTLPYAEKHQRLLALIETKLTGGRDATTKLEQSQNALNKDWQDFTVRIAPAVTGALDYIAKSLDKDVIATGHMVDRLQEYGKTAGQVISAFTSPTPGYHPPAIRQGGGRGGVIHGATGFEGTVTGPTMFMAGEAGSEHVSITPHGGSGGTHIHVHVDRGAFIDGPSVDRLANLLAQRLSYVSGR